MVFLKTPQNSLNQKRTIHKKFHENDFLKNQIFPEYAGPLLNMSPHISGTSVFCKNLLTKTKAKSSNQSKNNYKPFFKKTFIKVFISLHGFFSFLVFMVFQFLWFFANPYWLFYI
jgi:hypothetical protein